MTVFEIMGVEITMTWSVESVRKACIFYDLYTKGDDEAYTRMLWYVGDHEFPTFADIEYVCKDIAEHSDKHSADSAESVLWCILRRAVTLQPKC